MSDFITVEQIAELVKVSEEQVKGMLGMGGYFAMVPRGTASDGSLVVYRKDLEPFLAQKLEEDLVAAERFQIAWDTHFGVAFTDRERGR